MNLLFPNGEAEVKELSADAYKHLAINEIIEQIAVTEEDQ